MITRPFRVQLFKPLAEYRATGHIFGNKSSPAAATFGLRHSINRYGIDEATKLYVNDCFYVADGLGSVNTVEEATTALNGAKSVLAISHSIA